MSREVLSEKPGSYIRRDDKYVNRINCVGSLDTACAVCGKPRKRGAGKYCGIDCYRIVQRSVPVDTRFWSSVEKTPTCWLWVGFINEDCGGYGYTSVSRDGRSRPVLVHRLSWELANGPIPPGQSVLHHCDVPACVNPAHLFLGTQKRNMEDAATRQRLHVPRPTARKLDEAQREDVRQRYAAGGVTMQVLADEFGVTKTHIWQLVHKTSVEFRARRSA